MNAILLGGGLSVGLMSRGQEGQLTAKYGLMTVFVSTV
jgi:hypothetical protein